MKTSTSVPYTALPYNPHDQQQNVIVLTYYRDPPPNPVYFVLRRCLLYTLVILLLSTAVFILYPSDPHLQLSRIQLNHIRVNSSPRLTLDLSFSLVVKVRNPDFFSFSYESLSVSIGYRGRELGFVRSNGGKLRPRATSYVDATLDLDGLEVIHDVFYLIEDLARGVIPLDTIADVKGSLGLLFLEIPIEGKTSCEVYVSTGNQTVVHQNCYPE